MATAITNNVTSIAREASSSADSSHANPYYILAKHLAQVLADASYVRALSRIPRRRSISRSRPKPSAFVRRSMSICAASTWTSSRARSAMRTREPGPALRRREAGIGKRVHPRGLRHAHASHALDRGAPTHLVQQTLGRARALIMSPSGGCVPCCRYVNRFGGICSCKRALTTSYFTPT